MANVFIKTSCSTQPRCGDQLSCVFSSPVGCNQRAPGTEQNPALFALQIPRQPDYPSMLHWGWCSSWQTDISILNISNMDQHRCQTLHQLQDKVFITVLKWAKLSLSGFSSFEQGFLAASFFPALLSAWGLEQSHLHPCYNTSARPTLAQQWIKNMWVHGSTDTHVAKTVVWKFHCLLSFPLFIILPFTFTYRWGSTSFFWEQLGFAQYQDAAESELLCINSLALQFLKPSHALEISVFFSTLVLRP